MPSNRQPALVEVAGIPHVYRVALGVGAPDDEPALLVIRQLQHGVGGKLVCRVLLPSEDRDLQEIEQRVSCLMQKDVDRGPNKASSSATLDGRFVEFAR